MNKISRLLLVLGLILSGCNGQAQPTVVAPAPGGPVEAAISGVEVLRSLVDPLDVRVVVNGTLPDGCTLLKDAVIEREGRLFSVIFTANRAALGECLPGPVAFERVVRLKFEPNAGAQDGNFGVLVNGQLHSFAIPAVQAAGSVAVTGSEEKPQPASDTASVVNNPVPAPTASAVEPAPAEQPAAVPPKIVLGPASGPASCVNKAAFFEDVTIPAGTSLEPGTPFVKIWKVRNEGTCTWSQDYKLLLVDGDPLGAPASIPLPPAAPLEVVQVSVPMAAPTVPGSYHSEWGFSTPEGQSFGVGSAGLYPLAIKVGVRQPPPAAVGCEATFDRDIELSILELINAERATRGLPPHGLDDALSQVARDHSAERGCIGVHSHSGADGTNYESRVRGANIAYKWINEIIYNGNFGAKPAVNWWVYQSQLHHDIVMAKKYTTIGVGYAKTKRGANKEYFTVLFSTPP